MTLEEMKADIEAEFYKLNEQRKLLMGQVNTVTTELVRLQGKYNAVIELMGDTDGEA